MTDQLSWRSWQRVGLIILRSPVRSRSKAEIPVSLGGQDTRLSPERPGFNSRTGNIFFEFTLSLIKLKFYFYYYNRNSLDGRVV